MGRITVGGGAGFRCPPALILGLAAIGVASGGAAAGSFEEAVVRFEHNATDGDFEVVFEVDSGDEGLLTLTVTDPHHRPVIDFRSPEDGAGMRQLVFESPEPPDRATVEAAFPEGQYEFLGTTVSGNVLRARAALDHQLPPEVSGLHPEDGAEAVPVTGAVISWDGADGIEGWILEIEDDHEAHLEILLPASATSFALPDGFLAAGTEYQIGMGAIASNGNITVVEIGFETAE